MENQTLDEKEVKKNTPEINKKLLQVPVVAIGASAGGLEPLEQFFDAISGKSNNAYVVIQHLSPNFESMMDELLSRHSGMDIKRVTDKMMMRPNTIYLNPPRTEIKLVHGRFRLSTINEDTHINLPIDAFFESLADEYETDAIAIVLSGTGSDGTKGSKAIKEKGGIVLAQNPASAKFDSMPSSIISKGYVDAIAMPEEFPKIIDKIRSGLPIQAVISEDEGGDPILRIFKKLRERFGTDFNYYKKATIERRLKRRSDMRNINLEEYAKLVVVNSDESEALYADLLIEVTSFFRDREAYDVIKNEVVPKLAAKMSDHNPIRIWVPGCASGEEAYSIAILIADYAVKNNLKLNLKILATDIHHRSLDAAAKGIYTQDSIKGLSDDQLERYFDQIDSGFQVKQNIRRMVVFSPHNILKDPPFTKMDMISCRNVLIYLNDIAQQKTLAFFHFALTKRGVLFLGPSETTGKLDSEFSTLDQKWRIFEKKRDIKLLDAVSMLPADTSGSFIGSEPTSSLEALSTIPTPIAGARHAYNEALKELIKVHGPSGFLITRNAEIVHVFGDSGTFLKIQDGLFSNKIIDLVNEDLKLVINTGIDRLKTIESIKFERKISAHDEVNGHHTIVVTLSFIVEAANTKNFILLTLERVKHNYPNIDSDAAVLSLNAGEASTIMRQRIEDLERDLTSSEESLQSTIEELETSNEELQATNEELMASNEELQSTNEELHSVNEELYTVSAEHQRKIEELTELTDDMDHLLKATDIGIIFLGADSTIRRFTPSATLTFNLMPQDISRPIDHITSRFKSVDVGEIVTKVKQEKTLIEKEVQVKNKTYVLRVLPYVTALSESIGAVITTIDISDLKAAQMSEIETSKFYEEIVSGIDDFIVRWDAKTNLVTYCNSRYCEVNGLPAEEIIGSNLLKLIPKKQKETFENDISKLKIGKTKRLELVEEDKTGIKSVKEKNIHAIPDENGNIIQYQANGQDITQQFRYRVALEELNQIGSSSDVAYETMLKQVLNVGLKFLKLPTGTINRTEDKECVCISIVGKNNDAIKLGKRFNIENSIYSFLPDGHETFSANHMGASLLSRHSSYIKTEVETFINARIHALNSEYGIISFSDTRKRKDPFTQEQIIFVQLLASKIGHLINREEALQNAIQRRQHYQEIFYQSPVMMCTVDNKGKLLSVNNEWLSALEYDDETVVGKSLDSFVYKGSKQKGDIVSLLSKSIKSTPRKELYELATSGDEQMIVELSAIPRKSSKSGKPSFLVVMEDVTARTNAMSEVERQKEALIEANEGLSQFAYIASHDLQEPLRKIKQFGSLLEEDYGEVLADDGKYLINVMTNSAARISKLVSDLLAYSRTSKEELSLKNFELSKVLESVIFDFSTLIEEKDAKVKLSNLPKVFADKVAVQQLFNNLIGNALKYSRKDEAPNVQISARKGRTRTIIKISDNGIGIDRTAGQDIFDPFIRLEKRSDFEGSGIGLAICKAVCDRLGWHISYDSELGVGTTFSISIPNSTE